MKMNKKGFTLAELLIVIAIIAILIAIAIPVFGAQLENARIQADHANIRSAYAIVQTAKVAGVNIMDATGATSTGIDTDGNGTVDLAAGYTYTTEGKFEGSTGKVGQDITMSVTKPVPATTCQAAIGCPGTATHVNGAKIVLSGSSVDNIKITLVK